MSIEQKKGHQAQRLRDIQAQAEEYVAHYKLYLQDVVHAAHLPETQDRYEEVFKAAVKAGNMVFRESLHPIEYSALIDVVRDKVLSIVTTHMEAELDLNQGTHTLSAIRFGRNNKYCEHGRDYTIGDVVVLIEKFGLHGKSIKSQEEIAEILRYTNPTSIYERLKLTLLSFHQVIRNGITQVKVEWGSPTEGSAYPIISGFGRNEAETLYILQTLKIIADGAEELAQE